MRPIEGRGTDEEVWAAWPEPARWLRLRVADWQRVVVVAPHPDDEILCAGGILALAAEADIPLAVVAVTDGEASHPESRRTADLAARRTDESLAALTALGVDPSVRLRLRVPDGSITLHEQAVTDEVSAVLRPGDTCLTTWDGDGHPDHEATGRAVAKACAAVGATMLEVPVWTWHWAVPGDPDVPWHRAAVVDLPPHTAERKSAALQCFHSQVRPLGDDPADAPILPPHVLARFERSYETVLR